MSIKAMPMSLVMEAASGKSYLINIIDCPGHVNFNDELTAALRLADGMILAVDACEGVMLATERAIRQAVLEDLPISLLITKVCSMGKGAAKCNWEEGPMMKGV